jgi:hypothetical protein
MHTIHSCRNHVIDTITATIDPEGEFDVLGEYDVEAIADQAFTYQADVQGWVQTVDVDELWKTIEKNERFGSDPGHDTTHSREHTMTKTITTTDITTALHAADIDYTILHPDTTIESIVVTCDGGRAAFGPGQDEHGAITGDGIDLAWYRSKIYDEEVSSTDWFETVGELVAALRRFIG